MREPGSNKWAIAGFAAVAILLMVGVIYTCRHYADNQAPKPTPVEVASDTVAVVVLNHPQDSVIFQPVARPAKCDSIKKLSDSIAAKLFLAQYKLERVKYYLKICLRNPSQDKFLKGWIKRAIE
jgi:hypothetical protein